METTYWIDYFSIGLVVGATLGFLAFLLAFTFNMAANRYDTRKGLLVEEQNAINATYRRSGPRFRWSHYPK
jgi:hypothetical protein